MINLNFYQLNLPITVAISGASGTIYGLRLLQFLINNNYKVELVISDSACKVALDELNLDLSSNPEILKEQVLSYLGVNNSKLPPTARLSPRSTRVEAGAKGGKAGDLLNVWAHNDISASISSGSYKTCGMIIIPASMGTVGRIASGISDNLITRAADVCLKEGRKLILVPREMPYSAIHLENLLKLSRAGAVIAPASPAFYHSPKELTEIVDFVVGKVLDLFGIEHILFKRWKEETILI